METVSVMYRLVPKVPGHVLLPKVAAIPDREKVREREREGETTGRQADRQADR